MSYGAGTRVRLPDPEGPWLLGLVDGEVGGGACISGPCWPVLALGGGRGHQEPGVKDGYIIQRTAEMAPVCLPVK